MTLTSIASITKILFEVPTGAISDFLSRKLSLFIGSMLCSLSLIVFVVGKDFIAMILAEIIFSIGITCRSGTEQAILYDSLKNNKKEKEFAKIDGDAKSNFFLAQAFGLF